MRILTKKPDPSGFEASVLGDLAMTGSDSLRQRYNEAIKTLTAESVALLREWGVTALRFWVIRHGVMAASAGGKLKTVLQTGALAILILPLLALTATATRRVARDIIQQLGMVSPAFSGWASPGMFVPEFEEALEALFLQLSALSYS